MLLVRLPATLALDDTAEERDPAPYGAVRLASGHTLFPVRPLTKRRPEATGVLTALEQRIRTPGIPRTLQPHQEPMAAVVARRHSA